MLEIRVGTIEYNPYKFMILSRTPRKVLTIDLGLE